MTAALVDAAPAPDRAALDDLGPAATRGRLDIAERVVARIATAVVSEVDGAAGSARTVLGASVGSADDARADAQVDAGTAVVSLRMGVVWPHGVRSTCAEVRRRVVERVSTLTGLTVAHVDITVPSLVTDRPASPRVV